MPQASGAGEELCAVGAGCCWLCPLRFWWAPHPVRLLTDRQRLPDQRLPTWSPEVRLGLPAALGARPWGGPFNSPSPSHSSPRLRIPRASPAARVPSAGGFWPGLCAFPSHGAATWARTLPFHRQENQAPGRDGGERQTLPRCHAVRIQDQPRRSGLISLILQREEQPGAGKPPRPGELRAEPAPPPRWSPLGTPRHELFQQQVRRGPRVTRA